MSLRRKILLLTLVSIVFIVASRIANFGWLMVGGGFILIILLLFIHLLFQVSLILRNGKRLDRAMNISAASNISLCIASFFMPDFGDMNSYAFFGLYINPPEYFVRIATLFGALGMALSLSSVMVGWKR